MSTHLTGSFKVTWWNEETFEEFEGGRRLTRAKVALDLAGDLEGRGSAEWLMCYREDGTATFVGLQRLVGHTGSFVVESRGTFDGQRARGRWTVVPGSGTAQLSGIHGDGAFEAPMGSEATFELDYELG